MVDRGGHCFSLKQSDSVSAVVRGHFKKSPVLSPSHGGNTGSNPVGDAKEISWLETDVRTPRGTVRKKYGIGVPACRWTKDPLYALSVCAWTQDQAIQTAPAGSNRGHRVKVTRH